MSLLAPKTLKVSWFFLMKGNITIKKQTISGLFVFKTKFEAKMTGEKKTNNSKNM